MRGKSRAKSTSASTESYIGAIAPSAFRDVAALASFRDLIAISTITLSRALELRHRRGLRVMFGEAFAIYPWMLDRGGYAP